MVTGFFQERLNRFLALVLVEGKPLPCFLPNPGRMPELLKPGVEVILKEARGEGRKTLYDIIGVIYQGRRVSIDARIPNRLILEALKAGELEEFRIYDVVKPEQRYRETRFDFLLAHGGNRCLLEVKSCTLVRDGKALFPDAPTTRGRRHLHHLMTAREEGYRACILFLIQRTDAEAFSSNDETDPEFGRKLREAISQGVEAYVYTSEFLKEEIILRGKVEVEL